MPPFSVISHRAADTALEKQTFMGQTEVFLIHTMGQWRL